MGLGSMYVGGAEVMLADMVLSRVDVPVDGVCAECVGRTPGFMNGIITVVSLKCLYSHVICGMYKESARKTSAAARRRIGDILTDDRCRRALSTGSGMAQKTLRALLIEFAALSCTDNSDRRNQES